VNKSRQPQNPQRSQRENLKDFLRAQRALR
jgi:hypothetical protein